MIWHDYSRYEGKNEHATFSPSQPYWLADTKDEFLQRFRSSYAPQIGTVLHDFARKYIARGVTLSKYDKKHAIVELLESGIPGTVVDCLDFDFIFENLRTYVNECVACRMDPEIRLRYSADFFGTTDAIQFTERDQVLRISDLKTGTTPAKIEQLIVYAALFCLDYGKDPNTITPVLKIYQNNDILCVEPDKGEIKNACDKIVEFNELVSNERK